MFNGPIVIVEDDHDDWEIIKMVFSELGVSNELLFFDQSKLALDYLYTTSDQPFIILCDVNIPVINGIEFRKKITDDEFLRRKSIPFVFMSTSAAQPVVEQAYDLTVQGFFEKGTSYGVIKDMLKLIIEYWKLCRHPNR